MASCHCMLKVLIWYFESDKQNATIALCAGVVLTWTFNWSIPDFWFHSVLEILHLAKY